MPVNVVNLACVHSRTPVLDEFSSTLLSQEVNKITNLRQFLNFYICTIKLPINFDVIIVIFIWTNIASSWLLF